MNPTSKFIEGVVEECFRQGLTEKQASIVLDHAVYRAQAFTKQASDDPVNSGRARSILQMLAHSFLEAPGAANPLRMVEKHRDYRGPKDVLNAFNENADLISSWRNAHRIAHKTLKDEFKANGKSTDSDEFRNELLASTRKTFMARHLQHTRRAMELAEEAMRNTEAGTELYDHRRDLYVAAAAAHDAASKRLDAQLQAINEENALPIALRGIKLSNGKTINTIDEFNNYYKQLKDEVAARHSNKAWYEQSPREWLIRAGIGYSDEELQEAEKFKQKIQQYKAGNSALRAMRLTPSVTRRMTEPMAEQEEALDDFREAAASQRASRRGDTRAQGYDTPQPARTPSVPAPSTTQTSSQTPMRWSDMSVLDMARATNPSSALFGTGLSGTIPSLTSIQVNNI